MESSRLFANIMLCSSAPVSQTVMIRSVYEAQTRSLYFLFESELTAEELSSQGI